MNSQNKLSVVISAFNEEKKISKCLESIKWADEIIFVDNSSTDKTKEIAKKYTSNVFTQKNDPANIDLQKNFGIDRATGDWILILDADEEITNELRNEIKSVILNNNAEFNGFWIPRKNIIFGKWMEHSGWYPDYQLRLFKKGKGKYEKKHVHEPLIVDGETDKLKGHIVHYNYESIRQFLQRSLEVYAPNEAEEKLRGGYEFDYRDAIRFPLKEFLSRYFVREGYRDGFHGFMLSILMAFYHLAVFAYLWEKKDFVELSKEKVTSGLEEEFDKSKKELRHWLLTKKIVNEKNIFKKVGRKVAKKLHF